MRNVEVKEIWIDNDGRLCIRLADGSLDLSHIYRASASGVEWDQQLGAVCSPAPREWSYSDWFVRMVEDARNEYGVDLALVGSTVWRGFTAESRTAIELARAQLAPYTTEPVDARTMARYVGDDQLRNEARSLFNKKQWKAALSKLEAIKYPQFLDAADRRRIEIARERTEMEKE